MVTWFKESDFNTPVSQHLSAHLLTDDVAPSLSRIEPEHLIRAEATSQD